MNNGFRSSAGSSLPSIAVALALGIASTMAALPCQAQARGTLSWSDEFEGDRLDEDKWTALDRFSSWNEERQAYVPRNVSVGGGNLILASARERTYVDESARSSRGGAKAFTSGLVDSKGKYEFLYGAIEIRARFPRGKGLWPALWLLPADGSWPPEIDIAEMLGHETSIAYFANHWADDSGETASAESGPVEAPDLSAAFHTYALEWAKGSLRWYLDGKLVFESNRGVPDMPCYIVINTAVGGSWPGAPNRDTVFPQYHLVDFVRVYEPRSGS